MAYTIETLIKMNDDLKEDESFFAAQNVYECYKGTLSAYRETNDYVKRNTSFWLGELETEFSNSQKNDSELRALIKNLKYDIQEFMKRVDESKNQ